MSSPALNFCPYTFALPYAVTQEAQMGIKSERDLKYLDPDSLKGLSLTQVSTTKIRELVVMASWIVATRIF